MCWCINAMHQFGIRALVKLHFACTLVEAAWLVNILWPTQDPPCRCPFSQNICKSHSCDANQCIPSRLEHGVCAMRRPCCSQASWSCVHRGLSMQTLGRPSAFALAMRRRMRYDIIPSPPCSSCTWRCLQGLACLLPSCASQPTSLSLMQRVQYLCCPL